MLRITLSANKSSQFNFLTFENYQLPSPPGGIDAEVNNDVILNFEDEEEAIIYANQLQDMLDGLNDKNSPRYNAIGDIIMAVRNDEFVQSYLQ